jgi:uncharacterized protein YutE (UPF0331/DUF86 family)
VKEHNRERNSVSLSSREKTSSDCEIREPRFGVPMDANFETRVELSERLASLMQSVGFSLWQLQELEGTVATYLVVRVQARRGTGVSHGNSLLKQAEGRTLGALLKDLAKSGVIEDRLSSDLREMLEERNWLVHRARRENRGVLSNNKLLAELVNRLQSIAERSLAIQKSLAADLEHYVLDAGVGRTGIEREADRLIHEWGLSY